MARSGTMVGSAESVLGSQARLGVCQRLLVYSSSQHLFCLRIRPCLFVPVARVQSKPKTVVENRLRKWNPVGEGRWRLGR